MDAPDTKTCTRCGEPKPLTDYNVRSGKCRPCQSDYDREYRAQNAARLQANRKRWYAQNREANLAYQAGWRERNADAKRESDRAWREANIDRKRANDTAWRDANRDRSRAYFKARYVEKPEYFHAMRAKRKARKKGVEHQPWSRRGIYDRDGGKCRICGSALPFEPHAFHIDHIVPLSLGGPDIPANLQLACPGCNLEKRAHLSGQIHFGL